jgi:hypothetical protein
VQTVSWLLNSEAAVWRLLFSGAWTLAAHPAISSASASGMIVSHNKASTAVARAAFRSSETRRLSAMRHDSRFTYAEFNGR